MMIKKILKTILISILLLLINPSIEAIADNSIVKDEIIKYAIKKIKSTKNGSQEKYLYSLSAFYIKLGYNDDALRIFKMLEDEYYKYSIVFSIYDRNNSLPDDLLKKLIFVEKDIKDSYYVLDILLMKLSYFLNKNEKSYHPLVLKEFHEIIDKIKCIENHLPFQLLLQVVELLYDYGLKKEAQLLWGKIQEKSSYQICGNFISIIEIIKTYNHLCKIKKKNRIISAIFNVVLPYKYYLCKIKFTFHWCLAMLNIQNPGTTYLSIINSLPFWQEISATDKKIKCLSNLFANSIIEDVEIINQVKDFERILMQSNDFTFEKKDFYAIINFLEFLMKKNQYMKGKEILLKLISQKKGFNAPEETEFFLKYLYAFLIRDYLQSIETKVNSQEFGEIIKRNPTKAITYIMKFVETLNPFEDEKQFLQVIDQAIDMPIQDIFERDRILGDISMVCLKKGYFQKALEIIPQIENPRYKSILIYEVAQVFIKENKLSQVSELLTKYKLASDIKAYITSRIASRLMTNSKLKEAVKMFKESIDLLSKSDNGDFEIILYDYYNAKIKGKLFKIKVWGNMTTLDYELRFNE